MTKFTTYSKEKIDSLIQGSSSLSIDYVKDKIYPVGSIYISVNNTNPSVLFGGKWEQFSAGRVLMGAGNNAYPPGSEGGEATHTLTIHEIPEHVHPIDGKIHKISGVYNPKDNFVYESINVNTNYHEGQGTRWDGTDRYYSYQWNDPTSTDQNLDGNQSHNNLQPYIVVFMWKRTA